MFNGVLCGKAYAESLILTSQEAPCALQQKSELHKAFFVVFDFDHFDLDHRDIRKKRKKMGKVFDNRNQIIVPLHRKNENGNGAAHAEKLFLTCTRKNAHVWQQKQSSNGDNES